MPGLRRRPGCSGGPVPAGLRALRPPSLGVSAAPQFCSAPSAPALLMERAVWRASGGKEDTWGDQELHVDVGRWLRPALPSHRHVTSGPADLGAARPADSGARLAPRTLASP